MYFNIIKLNLNDLKNMYIIMQWRNQAGSKGSELPPTQKIFLYLTG